MTPVYRRKLCSPTLECAEPLRSKEQSGEDWVNEGLARVETAGVIHSVVARKLSDETMI